MTTAQSPKLDPKALYWVEDPAKDGLPPEIAALAEYRTHNFTLCFHNSNRPHQLAAKFVSGSEASGLVFERPNGGRLIVRKLDVATFDRVFRPLIGGVPTFKNDAELTAFYARVVTQD
jgi:hypothetical protein